MSGVVNSVEYLITEGLGYCCEGFFWARYLDIPAPLIGARLGVTAATINRHKSEYRGKLHKCKEFDNCMLRRMV